MYVRLSAKAETIFVTSSWEPTRASMDAFWAIEFGLDVLWL
jgi:hypothetical protein